MSQLKKFLFTHRIRIIRIGGTIVLVAAAWILGQALASVMGDPVLVLGFSAVAVVAQGSRRLYQWIKGNNKEKAQ